jgi:hypothetical protein
MVVSLFSTQADDKVIREKQGLRVYAYNIPRGCLGAYYPECNVLMPLSHYAVEARSRPGNPYPCALSEGSLIASARVIPVVAAFEIDALTGAMHCLTISAVVLGPGHQLPPSRFDALVVARRGSRDVFELLGSVYVSFPLGDGFIRVISALRDIDELAAVLPGGPRLLPPWLSPERLFRAGV